MSKSDPQAVLSGLTLTNSLTDPAIDITGGTMTINSSATIQMGSITLTEEKFARMEIALEFIERFAAENGQARDVWNAIKAKKRILK